MIGPNPQGGPRSQGGLPAPPPPIPMQSEMKEVLVYVSTKKRGLSQEMPFLNYSGVASPTASNYSNALLLISQERERELNKGKSRGEPWEKLSKYRNV